MIHSLCAQQCVDVGRRGGQRSKEEQCSSCGTFLMPSPHLLTSRYPQGGGIGGWQVSGGFSVPGQGSVVRGHSAAAATLLGNAT